METLQQIIFFTSSATPFSTYKVDHKRWLLTNETAEKVMEKVYHVLLSTTTKVATAPCGCSPLHERPHTVQVYKRTARPTQQGRRNTADATR
jgi:hypothetical protein